MCELPAPQLPEWLSEGSPWEHDTHGGNGNNLVKEERDTLQGLRAPGGNILCNLHRIKTGVTLLLRGG